jgi:YVTN family beta-propeller protein
LFGIVAFPSSNKVGVVTGLGNNLLVVNVETGIIKKNIPTQQIVSHLLVLDPKKPLAYVTNINSGSVSVIDLKQNKVIKNIPCGLKTEGIDITPDGSEIWVTNNKENTISVINTTTYQITNTLTTGKESLRLKFSIDVNTVWLRILTMEPFQFMINTPKSKSKRYNFTVKLRC